MNGFELTASSPAVGQGSGPNTTSPDFKQRAVAWGRARRTTTRARSS